MLTGDAILTAAHVASEVEIISSDKNKQLILEPAEGNQALTWTNVGNGTVLPFSVKNLEELSQNYDLCVLGSALRQAAQLDPLLWNKVHLFKVFARMSPEEKETIITCLNVTQFHCYYLLLVDLYLVGLGAKSLHTNVW